MGYIQQEVILLVVNYGGDGAKVREYPHGEI